MSAPRTFDPDDPADIARLAKITGSDLIRALMPPVLCMPPSGRAVFWATLMTVLAGAAVGCVGRGQTRALLVALIAVLDRTTDTPNGALH